MKPKIAKPKGVNNEHFPCPGRALSLGFNSFYRERIQFLRKKLQSSVGSFCIWKKYFFSFFLFRGTWSTTWKPSVEEKKWIAGLSVCLPGRNRCHRPCFQRRIRRVRGIRFRTQSCRGSTGRSRCWRAESAEYQRPTRRTPLCPTQPRNISRQPAHPQLSRPC